MARSRGVVDSGKDNEHFGYRPPAIDVRSLEAKAQMLGMKVYAFYGRPAFYQDESAVLSGDLSSTFDVATDIMAKMADLASQAVVDGSRRLSHIEVNGDRIDRLIEENSKSLKDLLRGSVS